MTRITLALLAICLAVGLQAAYAGTIPKVRGASRIVSGYQADPGQFPWQVIIKQDEFDDLLCGGSIISDSWVLTAGHCCYGHESLLLVFGTIDLYNDTALNMTATEFTIHPQYNPTNYNNDVCLIELPQPLTFSRYIAPITLMPQAMVSENLTGTVAAISGFGLQNDEYMDASDVLLWAQVQIINNSECSGVYEPGLVIESTLCAKGFDIANMSICNGDSGGALVTRNPDYNYVQIGINSFVPMDQCTEGLPSAYARLSYFLPFIYKVTGLTQY
ncbi:brachyurin [Musca vetustissima]|uniref:brachyurin n=1 Tax=Musca vetustissima TaxID=27455 RepID=UPI002AB736CC|nr:brachyurin [Musca vetustissima]